MAPRSRTICRSPCVNTLVDPAWELNKLAGAQSSARRFNAGSDEAPTPPEAFTPPLVHFTFENFFTKFMKVFMETTQARDQLEPRECSLKAKTLETYYGKSYINCYHFCQ